MSRLEDRYGNALTTTSRLARDAYMEGVDMLLSAEKDFDKKFEDAVALDERFALAHIALARARQLLGIGGDVKAPLERALALSLGTSPREQGHIAIFHKILTGRGTAAIPLIVEHLSAWPRDAMALAPATSVFGLLAFSGKAGREADLLALLESLKPAYGDDWWFLTVLAFAEIELQRHDVGMRNIDSALRGHSRNAHAAHIKSHLFYELGEREAGLSYLTEWSTDYPREGQLHCHISWHLALWSLETGRRDQAWKIYRQALHPSGSWGPPINVLTDCASFLLRAEIAGESVSPDHWRDVATYASTWFPNSGVTFADMHSALAFAKSGNTEALQIIKESPKGPATDILVPVALGFEAFARQDWPRVVSEIEPVLETHERVGGSRAQRDLLEYAVTYALLRSGAKDRARQLISRRRPQNGKNGFPLAGF